jgi:glucose/arabinose dehydrogenase
MRSNFINGTGPDGRGGILRVTHDGNTTPVENGTVPWQKGMQKLEEGVLGDTHPLNKYYAYGIRNGFGLDFDPTTGFLWDTENGAGFGDEINLVEPGFNSGWAKIQGVWPVSDYTTAPLVAPLVKGYFDANSNITMTMEKDILVNFSGKGRYSAPEFTWNIEVAPTALKFYNSNKLGKQYENDMFVAGFLSGNVYHFDLNENRTALEVDGGLKDRIANSTKELEDVIFAKGFGGITDIEVGPYDGNLYIVSYSQGKLYRITPLGNK